VVTYGFDRSFVDYFGSNGVNAVEQAFQVFNDLPRASDVVLSNFFTSSYGFNYQAAVRQIYDLKTATIALIIEQMGLGEPERSVFVLRQWSPAFLTQNSELDWRDWAIPRYIVERNYDPETLSISHRVNGNLFTGYVAVVQPLDPNPQVSWAQSMLVDPIDAYASAIAQWRIYLRPLFGVNDAFSQGVFAGAHFVRLSQDDVGGLRFLLSANRVSLEALLPDVHGVGSNALSYVNLADRPGIEKITFVRHPYDAASGSFLRYTNQWIDTFFTNGVVGQQQLERVTATPDFLFSAIDAGWSNSSAPFFVRSGAERWWNSAAGIGGLGPGVIRPPIQIAFSKLGPAVETYEENQSIYTNIFEFHWASFDMSTNPFVVYPQGQLTGPTNQLTIHQWFFDRNAPNLWNYKGISWVAPIPIGARAVLQTSTNLTDWVSLGSLTNEGAAVTWRHYYSVPERYFRVVGQ